MKVMSWNIWKGKYLEKVIKQIEDENPDIICLQEVIEQEVEGQRVNIAELIARKLGSNYIFCKSFTTDWSPPADLGNAIITRLPIISSSCHMLSDLKLYKGNSLTEPRCAVKIKIQDGKDSLTIISTHLAFGPKVQETQMQSDQLDVLLTVVPKERTILCGDFNSLPNSKVFRILNNLMVNTDPVCTEYSFTEMKDENHPEYRIDYIYTTSDVQFEDFKILSTDASDHSPLSVEIRT